MNPLATTVRSRIWAALEAIRLTAFSWAGSSVMTERSTCGTGTFGSMNSMTLSPWSARSRSVSSIPARSMVRSTTSYNIRRRKACSTSSRSLNFSMSTSSIVRLTGSFIVPCLPLGTALGAGVRTAVPGPARTGPGEWSQSGARAPARVRTDGAVGL